jgi:hypothetical protein
VWGNFEGFVEIAMHASFLHVPSLIFSSQLSKAKVLDLGSEAMDNLGLLKLRDCLTSLPHVHTFKLKLLTTGTHPTLPATEIAQIICAFEHLEELHLRVDKQPELHQCPTWEDQMSFFRTVLCYAPHLRTLDLSKWTFLGPFEKEDDMTATKEAIQTARHSNWLLHCLRVRDARYGEPYEVWEVNIDSEH